MFCCVSAVKDIKTQGTHFVCGSKQEEQTGDKVVGSKAILTVHVCDKVGEAWSVSVVALTTKGDSYVI